MLSTAERLGTQNTYMFLLAIIWRCDIIRILRAIDEFALSVDRAALMDECSFAGMASVFALTSTDR